MKSKAVTLGSLEALAAHLRSELNDKKFVLLYAYNGTGKTRLSMAFKDAGRQGDARDTLYFNAFTEDLFSWDNDLAGDSARVLKLNRDSRFFRGIEELEMETRIRPFLSRYADFDFRIDYAQWTISFSRSVGVPSSADSAGQTIDNIKISRGEENIFIWCFFLAIVQLAVDGDDAYQWVNYIYIDDPISSLDDNNAIAIANNLAKLLKNESSPLKTVISSHHTLFFNVLCNEITKANKYFLSRNRQSDTYTLRDTRSTPFFHHVATLVELHNVARSGELYTHHFTMLRSILEKTASFHGFENFSACLKQDDADVDGILHTRLINILSHGNYSLYEPQVMLDENKAYFRKILAEFMQRYAFNPDLFGSAPEETTND